MNLGYWEFTEGITLRLNAQITMHGRMLYVRILAPHMVGCGGVMHITLLSLVKFASPKDYLCRSVNEKTTLDKDKAVKLAVEYARDHIRFSAKHLKAYYASKGYVHYITRKGKICKVGDMHHTPITIELVDRGMVERVRMRNLESLIYEEI